MGEAPAKPRPSAFSVLSMTVRRAGKVPRPATNAVLSSWSPSLCVDTRYQAWLLLETVS